MPPRRRVLALSLTLAALCHARASVAADAAEPIRYTLRFPAPQTHYVEVEAVVPTGGAAEVELMMAGLDARLVPRPRVRPARRGAVGRGARRQGPGRREGRARTAGRSRPAGAASVTVSYRVYCREMGVQTNWVDARLRPAQRRGDVPDPRRREPRPHEVTLDPAARLAQDLHRPARRPRRQAAPLRRPRLRHPGRLPDLRRQPGRLRVRGRRQAALPRQRGRGGRLGRPAVGQGRRGDRPGRSGRSGVRCPTTSTSSSTC